MSGRNYAAYFNITTILGQSVYLFAWYVISIAFSMWAIGALATQNVDAITPTAVGWFMPIFTSLVHLSLLAFGYFLVEGYVMYPVWPKQLFAVSDGLVGLMFVLSIVGLAVNSLALLMVVNAFLVVSYLLNCYKYFEIVSEIQTGVRSARTGALRE